MALELTLSCDSNNTESGPTLIHSTGVEHYKIPPEVVGNTKDFIEKRTFSIEIYTLQGND
jgi:hypothetical protein